MVIKTKRFDIFSNCDFYLKAVSLYLMMEYNFIQVAAAAGLAIADSVDPIFQHIFDCLRQYLSNGITNVGLKCINCCWFVGVALVFSGTPQIIV